MAELTNQECKNSTRLRLLVPDLNPATFFSELRPVLREWQNHKF